MNTAFHLFESSAKIHGSKIAIIDKDDRSISFEELLERSKQKAEQLSKLGYKKGDRIVLLIPMSLELYIHLLAMFSKGFVPVFLDPWMGIRDILKSINNLECVGILSSRKIILLSYFFLFRNKFKSRTNFLKNSNINLEFIPQALDEDDTALITLTTGTSGIAKAANRTHSFLIAQLNALKPIILSYNSNCDMPLLPIVLLLNLSIGRTSVIAKINFLRPSKFEPKEVIKQINKYIIESITGSPYYIHQLAINTNSNTSIKTINIGGGSLHFKMGKKIAEAFPKTVLNVVYGSTEAEPISYFEANAYYLNPSIKLGLCLGNPSPLISIKIIESGIQSNKLNSFEDLDKITLPINAIGEIIVMGKHVLNAYINNSSNENKIIIQGESWHRTGDLGYLADDNKIYYCGRTFQQHLTKNNGWINTYLIEQKIINTEKTDDCAVIFKHETFYIFISPSSTLDKCELTEIFTEYKDIEIIVKKINIPKDKRHHTKTDYIKLGMLIH